IQVGDVLVAAEGLALRSVTTLYAAMRDGLRAGTMRLTGVRGVETTFEVAVHVSPGDEVTLERAAVSDAATHTV
ncbi:MAG: hypothetical protein LBJ87_02915, partial [bacterium]|nr:hypothetical protein [bacterium]